MLSDDAQDLQNSLHNLTQQAECRRQEIDEIRAALQVYKDRAQRTPNKTVPPASTAARPLLQTTCKLQDCGDSQSQVAGRSQRSDV